MTPISVVIATRNRPVLFADALASVLRQSAPPTEVVVVNDGSDEAHRPQYAEALRQAGGLVREYRLIPRPKGHGQSYALNFGVAQATGDYLAFLDDDDTWIDCDHLQRATAALGRRDRPVDLYLSNQIAFAKGERRPGPLWIEDLEGLLRTEGSKANEIGVYQVSREALLRCSGFCHLNTLIVRRSLYEDVGGMDECIRWECDRDLVLRLMDKAAEIRHSPAVVARHNIPDPAAQSSMTTSLSEYERHLFQLRVLDRAALLASNESIRAYGRRHKGYTLKKIAESLGRDRRRADGAFYAREALGAAPTLKWVAYTIWRTLSSV